MTMLDDVSLADWCDRYLGARPACVLFRSGHLSEVIAAALTDGRRVVVKGRPADPRIAGCVTVQAHLVRAGFPCPVPLTAPTRVGGLTVTAETLVPGGSQRPAEGGDGALRGAPGPPHQVRTRPGRGSRARAVAAVDRMGSLRGAAVARPRRPGPRSQRRPGARVDR
jgi:hypothetical protein